MRFSRSAFRFLRSFRQRRTGLEPRPIALDSSESSLKHEYKQAAPATRSDLLLLVIQRHPTTSQGTAHGRFTRAIKRGHLFAAETAREMGSLTLSDALSLCLLYESESDPRFEKAMRRWLRRVRVEHALRHEQVELLRAAAGALRSPFRELGLAVLEGACRNCVFRRRHSRSSVPLQGSIGRKGKTR